MFVSIMRVSVYALGQGENIFLPGTQAQLEEPLSFPHLYLEVDVVTPFYR